MAARKTSQNINPAQAAAAAGGVSMKTPKSSRNRPNSVVVMAEQMNPASGFVNFLREQGVVGLAVGFIIGAQAQVVVKQLVTSFINPLFILFFGEALSTRSFSITVHGRVAVFTWGTFVYTLLNFLFIILAIYLFIKFFKLDKLDKPKKDSKK